MNKEQQYFLKEQLRTIKNLADTSILLIELSHFELLPTQLEFLFQECQQVLDEFCVKD